MQASELIEISIKAKEASKPKQDIFDELFLVAKQGLRETFIYKKLSQNEIEWLKNNGYKVNTCNDRNETFYKISW